MNYDKYELIWIGLTEERRLDVVPSFDLYQCVDKNSNDICLDFNFIVANVKRAGNLVCGVTFLYCYRRSLGGVLPGFRTNKHRMILYCDMQFDEA